MSWDFSLESSKIKWVILAFLLLLVLVFLAGYVSGVLSNVTVPDAGAKKTSPVKTPTPETTKTASAPKKVDEKPETSQPQNGGVVNKAGEGPAMDSGSPAPAPMDGNSGGSTAADGSAAEPGAMMVDGGDAASGDAPAGEMAAGSEAASAADADDSKPAETPAEETAASGESVEDTAAMEEPAAASAAKEDAPAEGGENAAGDAAPAASAKPDGATEDGGKKGNGSNGWTIQVGSFSLEMNAQDLKKKLKEKGMDVCILKLADHRDKWWYVVQVGEFKERAETKPVVDALKDERLVTIVKPITDTLMEQRTRCK